MIWLIRHAMCALYPREGDWPGMEDVEVTAFLRRYRREGTFLLWLGLCVGAWLFVWTPLITVYLPLPSFFLPRSLLDKHAYRITYTRIYMLRQMIFLVKLAAGLCWAARPEVRALAGMEPYPADPGTWRTEKLVQVRRDREAPQPEASAG